MAGQIDDVIEGVGGPRELAGLVPVVFQVLTVSDMGDGEDDPPVQQGQARGGKGWKNGASVSAASVNIRRLRVSGPARYCGASR